MWLSWSDVRDGKVTYCAKNRRLLTKMYADKKMTIDTMATWTIVTSTTERTSLMFVTAGSEVDDFYLSFILWFHQNILLQLAT